MNTDIRIKADFLDHPKLVKLKRRCGAEGILAVIRLWLFTAKYHPKGKLNGMDSEDIEIASMWNGPVGEFSSALTELKLLDFSGEKYSIHDWKEHNSFAYYAPERSAQARHAVKVREELKRKKRSSDRSSDRSSPSPSPVPSPNPVPKPKEKTPKSTSTPKDFPQEYIDFVEYFFDGKPTKRELETNISSLDMLIRLDKFDKDEIFKAVRACKSGKLDDDNFKWSDQVKSISGLRTFKNGRHANKMYNLLSKYRNGTKTATDAPRRSGLWGDQP